MGYLRARWSIPMCVAILCISNTGCHEVTTRSSSLQSANASYEAVVDSGDERYKVDVQDVVDQPVLIEEDDQKLEYPPSLLVLNLPVEEFVVKIVISVQGLVTDCTVTRASDNTLSSATREVFAAAIREFVLKWHFTPLTIHKRSAPNAVDVPIQLPFTLQYGFRFEVVNGKPAVNLSPQISPPIRLTD